MHDARPLHDTQAIVALPNKAEAAADEAEMPQALTDGSQPARDSNALDTDEACIQEHTDASGNSDQKAAAAAATQYQAQTMPDAHQQTAVITMPVAAVALTRSETFAEEDDYDADD